MSLLFAATLTMRRAARRPAPRRLGVTDMVYEGAKHRLRHALTDDQRREAIQSALGLGMPLCELELYLDWLDANQRALDEPPGQSRDHQSRDDQSRDDQSASGQSPPYRP